MISNTSLLETFVNFSLFSISPTKSENIKYFDIDNVVNYYYQHWFGKPKRPNFLSDLSHLKERNDFIRYDMFKDGHKLDEFSDKIIEKLCRIIRIHQKITVLYEPL